MRGARSVVLFVHGFGGDPEKTWHAFPAMFPREPACRSTDVIFYGYDSLRSGAVALAAELRDLLEVVLDHPAKAVNPTLDYAQRAEDFQYEAVVVVAHSLGAVVARRALLDLVQLQETSLDRVRLVLFAPAHLGADVLPLAREILGVVRLLPLSTVAAYRYRALRDLQEGSKVLTQLEEQTRARTAQSPSPHVARLVVHGEHDRIVQQAAFCADPPATFEPKDHVAICKPDAHYTNPLKHVIGAL